MTLNYPGKKIQRAVPIAAPLIENYIVNNCENQFTLIPDTGQTNQIHHEEETFVSINRRGKKVHHYHTINNHFQSMARHSSGDYLIISGGDKLGVRSHLILVKLENYLVHNGSSVSGPIGSNMVVVDHWKNDCVSHLYIIEEHQFWHAGGISLMGDILTVALESNASKSSKITYIDFRDVENPYVVNEIERPHVGGEKVMAGCATTIQLSTGHFFTAVWTDSDSFGRRFDFYISDNADDIYGGFSQCGSISADQIINLGDIKPLLQSIQFLEDTTGNIYLIGADNSSSNINRRNRMHLFKLEIDQAHLARTKQINPAVRANFNVTLRSSRQLKDGAEWYNFGAAPGFYVNPDNHELITYCAYTWKRKRPPRIKLCEFSPKVDPMASAIHQIADARIELYRAMYFIDSLLMLKGINYDAIPDFNEVKLSPRGDLKNRTHSIRIQLPPSHKVTFYEEKDYNQNDPGANALTIPGNGWVINIGDLSDLSLLNSIPGATLVKQESMLKKIQSMKIERV